MFTSYNDEEHKWFSNWEKNFETALKSVKKFREDLSGKPKFTKATAEKYRLYFMLLEAEIIELKEYYNAVEPSSLSITPNGLSPKVKVGEDSPK